MTERNTTYNGWANYPTWCVHLWLTNDETLYREAVSAVKAARNRSTYKVDIDSTLKTMVQEIVDADTNGLSGCMSADLLGYAMDCV